MALRYLPGEEQDMIETELAVTVDEITPGTAIAEQSVLEEGENLDTPDREDIEDEDDENFIMEIDEEWKYMLGEAVANVIIDNLDEPESYSEKEISFFRDEILDCTVAGLDMTRFTPKAFNDWLFVRGEE